jgi:hypothetical protein
VPRIVEWIFEISGHKRLGSALSYYRPLVAHKAQGAQRDRSQILNRLKKAQG